MNGPASLPGLLAFLSLAALSLSGCGTAGSSAMTVDGIQISDEQVAHETAVWQFLADLNQSPCGSAEPADASTGVLAESEQSACVRAALANEVELVLSDRYAAEHGIAANETDVKQQIASIEQQAGAAYENALRINGLTRRGFEKFVGRFLTMLEVQKAVAADRLDDDFLRLRYQQDLARYTTVQVDHIVVKTKKQAKSIYDQVTAPGFSPKDFLALAMRVSIDPSVGENSGALAAAPATSYAPEFRDAVTAMTPGQTSGPVHDAFGWHVIYMVDKQVVPFEKARDGIVQSQSGTQFSDWVREQLSSGGIDLDPRYGVYDLADLDVRRVSSTDPADNTATPSLTPVNSTSGD